MSSSSKQNNIVDWYRKQPITIRGAIVGGVIGGIFTLVAAVLAAIIEPKVIVVVQPTVTLQSLLTRSPAAISPTSHELITNIAPLQPSRTPTATGTLFLATQIPLPAVETQVPTMSSLENTLTGPVAVLAGTEVPRPIESISAGNASQISELARWGNGGIRQAAYSPDGRWIAVASSLGVDLYNAHTFEKFKHIETDEGVTSLAFSPDASILATGMGTGLGEGIVHLWQIPNWRYIRTIETQGGGVRSLAFSQDGSILATGGNSLVVRLWRVSDGSLLNSLDAYDDRDDPWYTGISSVAFSPNSDILASFASGLVRLWKVSEGNLLFTLSPSIGGGSLAFSADGRMLATGQFATAFSPDGTTVASGTSALELWTVPDGTKYQSLKSELERGIHLWQVSDGKLLRTLPEQGGLVQILAFSPDAKSLLSGTEDALRVWDASNGSVIKSLEGYIGSMNAISFSPDGRSLASGSGDDKVRIWSVQDGTILNTLIGHKNIVESVAFSPDGAILASGSQDGTIRLWHPTDGMPIKTLDDAGTAWSLSFSKQGDLLASASHYTYGHTLSDLSQVDRVNLWQTSDWALMRTWEFGDKGIISLAFSPASRVLALSSSDGTTQLWPIEGDEALQTFQEPEKGMRGSIFSPDGTLLATSSGDAIWLLRPDDGELLQKLEGGAPCGGKHVSMAFSPDGSILAACGDYSSGYNNIIRLWHINDGTLLRTIGNHKSIVLDVEFSPDGTWLASASSDGTIRLWGLTPK